MMIQIYTIDQRVSKSIYCYYTSFKLKQKCSCDRNGLDQSNGCHVHIPLASALYLMSMSTSLGSYGMMFK